MNTHVPPTLRALRSHDSGYAMATALLVGIIGFAITAVIVAMVLFTVRGSQRGSETVADRAVAEAGIDSAMAAIAQSTGNAVPCSINGSLSNKQQGSYDVTIAYYSASPTLDGAGNPVPLTCTPGGGVTATPDHAIITSTGTTAAAGQAGSTASRTMEARVTLTGGGGGGGGGGGSSSNVVPWVISSGSNFSVTKAWIVSGTNPEISVAGTFSCAAKDSVFPGNVYALGNVTLSDECNFGKDLWSGGAVALDNKKANVQITGNLKAVGALSMVKDSELQVGGNLSVASISGGSPQVSGTTSLSPPSPSVGNPPVATFPKISYNPVTWSGWNPVTPSNVGFPCTKNLTSPAVPTVYLAYTGAGAGCTDVNWTGNVTLNLTSDVTVFSDSFTMGGNVTVTSSNGSKLRLIVPWPAGATACPVPGAEDMTINGNFVVTSPAAVLLYTPGAIDLNGSNVELRGQIVACETTPNNEVTIEYVMVGAPGAGTPSPTPTASPSASPGNYNVTEQYRRDA